MRYVSYMNLWLTKGYPRPKLGLFGRYNIFFNLLYISCKNKKIILFNFI
jgi:hypothetical protein